MESLKPFASFLRENHLADLAKVNLEIIRPMHVPLMKYFEHLPEDQLLTLVMQGLNEFLTDLETGNALNKSKENLIKWENHTHEVLENISLEPSDLVLVSAAQNRTLMRFIPKFTDNPAEIVRIANGLTEYYAKTQEAAFEVFFRIRKKEEEALKESEERFRAVSQSANDGIIIFDLDFKIEFWNTAAENIFGYTQEEILGNSLLRIYSSDKHAEYTGNMARFKQDRQNEYIGQTFEMNCVHKNGHTIPVSMTLSFFETSKGSYYSIIVHDISERKKIEESLVKQATSLTRSNEELENFAYVASHDMKEPLRMITSYTQLISKNCAAVFDEDNMQYFAYVLDGTARMRNLIDALLEYSHLGHVEFQKVPVDLNRIVEQLRSSLGELIKETEADIQCDPLPTIAGNSIQMTQLFQNLISNGLKFISKGRKPQIHIKVTSQENDWVFSVEDNGIGINLEFKNKLFRMFQRLHSKEQYPGTGIGLAICKKIIERHDGKVWVESKVNEGTTFYFSLPKMN